MFRGSVLSGNLASLQNSDDDRLVMRPGAVFSNAEPPIQIILNATAPTFSHRAGSASRWSRMRTSIGGWRAWKECSVMEERLRFVARLLEGGEMSFLCREFGISRKNGIQDLRPLQGMRAGSANRPVLPAVQEWQLVALPSRDGHCLT